MDELDGYSAAVTIDQVQEPSGAWLVKLSGEVDISNSEALRVSVEQTLAAKPKKVVFDLSRLSFMDSSGLAVLILAANIVEEIEILDPSPVIRRVIQETGLSEILPISPP